ncbi:MAG: hypothetical protein D6710_01930 [Nitrospirae bacterium]|nr:MAG: hypothetical protein D6710_01930 [Nitrospirota bacterium]
MPRSIKTVSEMNADALRYLAENTDITYLAEGSIARSLVEATNSEIARVQEYIASTYANVFPTTASGFYLDLIGEMFGLSRRTNIKASTSAEDRNIKLSVVTGTLGDRFPNPANSNLGLIPVGLTISTSDGQITYEVSENVEFPKDLTEVFVPATAVNAGTGSNVGRHKLVSHSGPADVNVTNLKEISNGASVETDDEFRFRILNQVLAAPTANAASIRLALASSPDIARVELLEFSRGAGTFDALLVPVGNTLSTDTRRIAQRAIEEVSAFGINGRVVEPEYVKFRVSVQLIPKQSLGLGALDANKISAKNAILAHFDSIPLGGELIINRLRADIVASLTTDIKDIRIIDLCIDKRPHAIRNIQLDKHQLFTPDNDNNEPAIRVI